MGMNTMKEVLHLGNNSIAGLRDVKAKILLVLEFARTIRVQTEKLYQLGEGIIQAAEKVASAQDTMTHTFPSIIVEKERVFAEREGALLVTSHDYDVVGDEATKVRAHHTWLKAQKCMVLDEM
ncbi:hypothetical protein AMTR_s00064p00171790 [Amborella trichopoda]|uniref:Uncharacterized protein n=1 Tax=Amborella trichopoda TaxID=13333 RepID=U5D2F5_AMBTC|nr:hypothetical protein AMTR_s00064p00171790 [Amborella trichopoda]